MGRLQKLLRTKQIKVDGQKAETSTRVCVGQEIRVPPLDNEKKPFPADQIITIVETVVQLQEQILNERFGITQAKIIVKIIARIFFDFCKTRKQRAQIPFHLFLEEAHRYVQKDADVFLIGYNIFSGGIV